MRLAGRLAALERQVAPLIALEPVAPHPLPDLACASAESIVAALFDAEGVAHVGAATVPTGSRTDARRVWRRCS